MVQVVGYTSPNYVKLVLDVVEESYDILSNTSLLRWTLKLMNASAWAFNYDADAKAEVEIDGETVHSGYHAFDTRNGAVLLASGTKTVTHDDNGSKTIVVWARMLDISTLGDIGWKKGELKLTDIPRSSRIKSVEGNTLGSTITVNLEKYSNSYHHQVWWKAFGGDWIDLGTTNGTTVTFTPDLNLAEKIPNSTSGELAISVRTYYGSKHIGDVEGKYTLSIPANGKPTINDLILTETNPKLADVSTNNTFVQILSVAKVNFGVTPYLGSTIKSYYAEVVGYNNTISTDGAKLNFFSANGKYTIRGHVTDSRGIRSDIFEKVITVVPYFLPTVTVQALRSGSRNDTITLVRNIRIAPVIIDGVRKNSLSMIFRTKKTLESDNNWTKNAGGELTNVGVENLTNSSVNLTGNFSPEFAWDIQAVVRDRFSDSIQPDGVRYNTTAPSEAVILNYTPEGIGVMKIREKGALDVGGDIYSNGKLVPTVQLAKPDGRTLAITGDANKLIVGGMYATNNVTNLPQGAQRNGYLWIINHHNLTNYLVQYYTPHDKDELWIRRMYNSTWNNWRKFAVDPGETKVETKWVNISIWNGWKSNSGEEVQVSKHGNLVTMRGIARNGPASWGAQVGYLPAGFRPSRDMYLNALNEKYGRTVLFFKTDGVIEVRDNATGPWMGFDGIIFPV
nr:MAG TPA: protein of unknown function DUF859 [Caudoviricetes sp.]